MRESLGIIILKVEEVGSAYSLSFLFFNGIRECFGYGSGVDADHITTTVWINLAFLFD